MFVSKIIFVEGVIRECDRDRAPKPSQIFYAKDYIEEKEDIDGENNKTDNIDT